ncbi:phage baseplate assembly protein V [Campylobacter fetus]|uniref:phage baseplate assembly protein V n=1 Tax=Campylobacter fetus TaxID=196 RepID=UPI00073AB221|nr:phage baseplate assembly protein V [Campylobacter fetus]ALV64651.1 phage baseplate assembly protein V [Campylobacter fetus subsp. testudinum Sp3]
MITLGTICEVEVSKSLVKVNYQGTISKFIPYLQKANSFKQSFTPPRVGEQVILYQCSNGNFKFCQGAICTQANKEPNGSSSTKEITQYEDGTIVSYDIENSTMEILNPKTLNLSVQNSIDIKATTSVTITAPHIFINGNLKVSGDITDSRGDLTGHSHIDSDGATSNPR